MITKIERDENTGELLLILPEEILEQVNWKIGDTLVWEETEIWEDTGEFKGAVLKKLEKPKAYNYVNIEVTEEEDEEFKRKFRNS